MYKIGDIFSIDNEYSKRVDFCNENNLIIEDIGNNLYTIKELPKPTQKEIIVNEINDLKIWYETYYSQHEQKLRRLNTLGKLTDTGNNPYDELIALYQEAETKRARIQELERLLSDNSK